MRFAAVSFPMEAGFSSHNSENFSRARPFMAATLAIAFTLWRPVGRNFRTHV
jgi:hypothetical protein